METKEILQIAAHEFAVGTIQKLDPATTGLGNENYFVTTDKGEYVLRILKAQTLEGLQTELAIENQLEKSHVLTSHLMRTSQNENYCKVQEKIVTCSERIKGEHPQKATPQLAQMIGETLGRFHTTIVAVPPYGFFWLKKEATLIYIQRLPQDSLAQEIVACVAKNVDIFEKDLPQGYIHGDLHLNNLIITPNDELAIFDFESTEKDILLLDLAISAVSLYDKTPDTTGALISNLFEGYERIRSLSSEEKHHFKKAVLYISGAAAAWHYTEGYAEFAQEYLQAADTIEKLSL